MHTGSQAAGLHSQQNQQRTAAAAGEPQGGRSAHPQPAPQIYYGIMPPPWLWGLPSWIVPAAVPQTAAQPHGTVQAAAPQAPIQPYRPAQVVPQTAAHPHWTVQVAAPLAPPQAVRTTQASAPQPPDQGSAAVPPANPVPQMAPVRLVPGVAPVPYPVLPEGTRNRRYWL